MGRLIVGSFALVCLLGCTTALPSKASEPLFLTSYIENGEHEIAREKAEVQHKEMKGVKSYAGYLTINKKYNSNSFFWYFPSEVRNYFSYQFMIRVLFNKISAIHHWDIISNFIIKFTY